MKTKPKSDRRTLSSSLSSNVLKWLLQRGFSQVEVAGLLGVSQSFISVVKSRERSFTLDHMEALAAALHMPLGEMFLQITERNPAASKQNAVNESATRLIKKLDTLAEKLRQEVTKRGEGGAAGSLQ